MRTYSFKSFVKVNYRMVITSIENRGSFHHYKSCNGYYKSGKPLFLQIGADLLLLLNTTLTVILRSLIYILHRAK